jgi:hypothetical protein
MKDESEFRCVLRWEQIAIELYHVAEIGRIRNWIMLNGPFCIQLVHLIAFSGPRTP